MNHIYKHWKFGAVFYTALIFLTHTVTAQSITLTIPDTAYIKGQTVKLPVKVSAITAENHVLSGQFSVSSNGNNFFVESVDAGGTLLSGKQVLYNSTTKSFAFSSTTDIVGSGVLIYLNVKVSPNASGTNTISLTNAKLNEGNPAVILDPGNVRIKSVTISPKTPPNNLTVGDGLQFSVSGDGIAPFTWSSQNTNAATVSSTGNMTGTGVGSTKIQVTDSQGLSDSTNLFAIYSPSLKSLTISLRDTSYRQTLEFNYPVYVSDVSSLDLTSAQFSFNFNSGHLSVVDIVTENSMSSGWFTSYKIENGTVAVTMAGSNALSGSGVLVYIRVKVQPSALGQTSVSLTDVVFNEDIFAAVVNGKFTALAAPIISISPNTGILTVGDKIIFSVMSGGTAPYKWSVDHADAAVINESTGEMDVLAKGTVKVTATDVLGFKGTTGVFTVNSIHAEIPESTVLLGNPANIPVNVEDVTGLGIFSYQSTLSFDTTKFSLGGVYSGTITTNFSLSYHLENGVLSVAGAGAQELSGEGSLFYFTLNQKPDVSAGQFSVLDLKTLTFNEPGNSTPTATLHDGKLTLEQLIILPSKVSLVSPDSGAAIEADSVNLSWSASEPNVTAYELVYSINDDQFGISYGDSNLTSLEFNLTNLGNSSFYYWKVRAKNEFGWGPFSDTRSFSVQYTVPVLPDTVILVSPLDNILIEADSVKLVWKAAKPDILHYVVEYAENDNAFQNPTIVGNVVDTVLWLKKLDDEVNYFWRVKAVNQFGEGAFSNAGQFHVDYVILSVEDDLRTKGFALTQNYPNPFNPNTSIGYQLSAGGKIKLTVFDLLGREVATLVDESKPAGKYSVNFKADGLPSGVYIYQLKSGSSVQTKKMLLVK